MRNSALQTELINSAGLNPRKPYFSATYRNDILKFASPVVGSSTTFNTNIAWSYQALSSTSVLVAGYDSNMALRAGTVLYSSWASPNTTVVPDVSTKTQIVSTGRESSIQGCWSKYSGSWRYYFFDFLSSGVQSYASLYSVDANGADKTEETATGLPYVSKYPVHIREFYGVRRPSAFVMMEHGDKIAVYTFYEYITELAQLVCTMHFYHAGPNDTSYRRLRTTIQYEIPNYDSTRNYDIGLTTLDVTSGLVFGASSEAGKFFIVANDGTKAIRFTYTQGVEGLAEPVIPIDIDANRLEITDSFGEKTYGKYHQFMPCALTKIGSRYYLNGQMTRTYSNGDKRVMEIYLWSVDGINWAVGDVSSFIDAEYYKKSESVRPWNYALVYFPGGDTVYAFGNKCRTSASAREMDSGNSETDFSDVVIEGAIESNTNSADNAQLMSMKGFDTVDPSDFGGKTFTINLGYYDSSENVKSVKMGEYFVDSETHVLSNAGKGPNQISGSDLGAWKLTRWSSITDVDRWSSTFVQDDLKMLSKMIVKGISSDYSAVDNATGSGLYLSNLNDPFVGYTSTRDDRDGMYTVCARFTDTGSTAKLSSIGLLIGAEDYTDIYTKGKADRKGFNAIMIPSASTWTGQVKTSPQMRKSNLKRRTSNPSTPGNESDADTAFQWLRRYTNLWERSVYIADQTTTDSQYNKITSAAATAEGNIIYSSNFVAEHGTDYEFVVRKNSGRIQAFARKKGFSSTTVAASAYTEYQLIYEYQFSKDDRIDWGPRPFWGFVANTDVFASLDGWNSREYGDIETSLTEAYNIADNEGFPESKLASLGETRYNGGTGSYVTTSQTTSEQVWVDREPSSGGGYWDTITTTTSSQQWVDLYNVSGVYYILQTCAVPGMTLSVGEIVRCYTFTGSINENNCSFNRGNTSGLTEFIAVINSIEDFNDNGTIRKKIIFGKTWANGFASGSGLPSQNAKYAIYKVGPASMYAKAFSGTIYSSVVTGFDGSGNAQYLNIDIKNGTVKQSSTTAGRAAIVNRQNDAISLRMMESDGSTHLMYSGSAQTGLGYDWPTNPISNKDFVGNVGIVSTRDWRLIMNQGRLFPFSSTTLGLPGGDQKSYMIKGEEIIRYNNWGWKSRGSSATDIVWCIISAYYTPIFPSVKGQTEIQQWSKFANNTWIEPGDKFNLIPNLSGLRLYINGKGGSYTTEGDAKQYAVSAVAANGGTASKLTFTPKLLSGTDFTDPGTERAKDADKQLKEIAILSGREQFGTSSGMQSYTDPLCFYPVGPDTTAVPDSFIKVNYTTMSVGLYNSAKDNLKYACNLAGISDVQFMDYPVSGWNDVSSTAETISLANLSNFVIEAYGTITTSSVISIKMRNAYVLYVDVDTVNSRGHLTLTLKTAVGFSPAEKISTGSGLENTIAKVSVPVSDIPLTGTHDFRFILRKERLMIEMDRSPVWTFDLKSYKFGLYDLYSDAAGPIVMTASSVTNNLKTKLVELSEEIENQIIDMSQGGGDAVQFITRERHIHSRSTQNGGLQFSRFLDANRENVVLQKTDGTYITSDFITDQLEYNPYNVPGHVLVTGAEYGEHLDPEWIRQNGYMFSTNQNRLLDTVEDSVKEAKYLIRMSKEDSDNSQIELVGLPHIQPEDAMKKIYTFPETVSVADQDQIVSGHNIQFNGASMMSTLKIRKKYSLE